MLDCLPGLYASPVEGSFVAEELSFPLRFSLGLYHRSPDLELVAGATRHHVDHQTTIFSEGEIWGREKHSHLSLFARSKVQQTGRNSEVATTVREGELDVERDVARIFKRDVPADAPSGQTGQGQSLQGPGNVESGHTHNGFNWNTAKRVLHVRTLNCDVQVCINFLRGAEGGRIVHSLWGRFENDVDFVNLGFFRLPRCFGRECECGADRSCPEMRRRGRRCCSERRLHLPKGEVKLGERRCCDRELEGEMRGTVVAQGEREGERGAGDKDPVV